MEPVQLSYALAVPLDQLPAVTPFATGADLIGLLDIIGDLEQSRGEKPRKVDWRLASASGGTATLRSHSDPDVAHRAAFSLVQGFGNVEESEHLPRTWSLQAGHRAARVAERLGDTPDTGLLLSVDGAEAAQAQVTRRAGRHLRSATTLRFASYGSVVGVLGRVTAHKGRRTAALWSDVDARRIEVRFGKQHVEDMRDAWAQAHVEVTGVLHENAVGQILRVDMDSLEILRGIKASLVEGLPHGFYKEMTGGLNTADYLKAIRGEQ